MNVEKVVNHSGKTSRSTTFGLHTSYGNAPIIPDSSRSVGKLAMVCYQEHLRMAKYDTVSQLTSHYNFQLKVRFLSKTIILNMNCDI